MSLNNFKIPIIYIFLILVSCNQSSDPQPIPHKLSKLDPAVIYPHSESFVKGQHRELFYQNSSTCKSCHGSDLAGGTSKVSCSGCHGENFPHPSGWARPGHHGEFFAKAEQNQRIICLKCHTSQENSTPPITNSYDLTQNPTCKECHVAYPHPDKFENPKNHKKLARAYEGKCINCHTDYKKYIDIEKYDYQGCLSCHDGNARVVWTQGKRFRHNPYIPDKDNNQREPQGTNVLMESKVKNKSKVKKTIAPL